MDGGFCIFDWKAPTTEYLSGHIKERSSQYHYPPWMTLISENRSRIIELTLCTPIPDEERKLTKIFIFTLLCGPSKGFIKDFKAFIKPFEAPRRNAKIKI